MVNQTQAQGTHARNLQRVMEIEETRLAQQSARSESGRITSKPTARPTATTTKGATKTPTSRQLQSQHAPSSDQEESPVLGDSAESDDIISGENSASAKTKPINSSISETNLIEISENSSASAIDSGAEPSNNHPAHSGAPQEPPQGFIPTYDMALLARYREGPPPETAQTRYADQLMEAPEDSATWTGFSFADNPEPSSGPEGPPEGPPEPGPSEGSAPPPTEAERIVRDVEIAKAITGINENVLNYAYLLLQSTYPYFDKRRTIAQKFVERHNEAWQAIPEEVREIATIVVEGEFKPIFEFNQKKFMFEQKQKKSAKSSTALEAARKRLAKLGGGSTSLRSSARLRNKRHIGRVPEAPEIISTSEDSSSK